MDLFPTAVYICAMFHRPLRRVLTLLALIALLPLQLFGAARAVACSAGGHVMDKGMTMAGMSAAGGASSATRDAQGDVRPAGAPDCEHDVAPEQCMVAPACVALVFSLPPSDRSMVVACHRDGAPTLTMLAPPSVTHPPALRPPRA